MGVGEDRNLKPEGEDTCGYLARRNGMYKGPEAGGSWEGSRNMRAMV